MQRSQEDRPTVAEILGIDFVQDMARRLSFHMGVNRKRISLQQFKTEKQLLSASSKVAT